MEIADFRVSMPAVLRTVIADFGPMPGTPGMLSDASPIKPNKSMICNGSATMAAATAALHGSTSVPEKVGSPKAAGEEVGRRPMLPRPTPGEPSYPGNRRDYGDVPY